MKIGLGLAACLLLSACVTPLPDVDRAAVEDFIAIHNMQEVDHLTTRGNLPGDISMQINDYHLRYKTGQKYFLVAFTHRCPIKSQGVTTDVRSGNTLRVQSDTIRGCRIDRIYLMTKEQAEELRSLGKAPPAAVPTPP